MSSDANDNIANNENTANNEHALTNTGSFIHSHILEDLKGETNKIHTRFPPEPNGYLHIGHAKGICINYGMAELYGGKYNLRFDDTNPSKEDQSYVDSIIEDIHWLGFDWEDRLYFASDFFDMMYDYAVKLIKKDKAFICELTNEQVKEYKGDWNRPGKNSPYRDRPIEESLDLFARMRNGEFADGRMTLRAKIDMSSSNINMRDPVIYRIMHISHHRTGDKWCIYPMYDYAHPLEDAIEEITHSCCSLEFEDHRPFYDWVVNECEFELKPRQIEYAKLYLANTVMGKRYLRKLVEDGVVEGWDDPRMVTLAGLRRRGVRPSAIRAFCDGVGISKANSIIDTSLFEHYIREDLKIISKVVMAVIDPVKVVITNYPDTSETLFIENNPENLELGTREVEFSKTIYIERSDFMENAPSKFFRLSPGKEVRLKGAYFITCNEIVKDENGEITELRCTYDPETKSGSGFEGRKVKGTIHWVSAEHAIKAKVRLFESLVFNDDTQPNGYRENPDSLTVQDCYVEAFAANAKSEDRFQFMRNGYYCLDPKLDGLVFNRIVSMRSSYK